MLRVNILECIVKLARCGHPIEEILQISIALNNGKWQYDNVIVGIHDSRNPYDIVSVSSVSHDAEARQSDLLFDVNITVNVAVNHSSVTK